MIKIVFIIILFSAAVFAQEDFQLGAEDRHDLTQAYEFYKKEQHESSIAILLKLKEGPEIVPSIYYLLGLNYYKISNYDLAEKYLLEVTRMNSIREIPLAYYYLGLAQYYKSDYEKAVNSLELSLDTSTDANHDKKVKRIITKIHDIQDQIEKEKLKYTVGVAGGYTYDKNALNVDEQVDDLSGHVLGVSAFASYRAYQEKDTSIEPTIYFSDNVTLDYKLKQEETIQSADSTLLLLTVPYKTMYQGYRSTSSINAGVYFLPSSTQRRELAISLIYFKQNLGTNLGSNYELDGQLIVGRDQSQLTYYNAADSQSAMKYDLSGMLTYIISEAKAKSVSGELGYIINQAEGDNASYNKIYVNTTYSQPTLRDTVSTLKLSYGQTDYTLSELERADKFTGAYYSISKDLTNRFTLSGLFSFSANDSTIADYSYRDYTAGIQGIYIMQF